MFPWNLEVAAQLICVVCPNAVRKSAADHFARHHRQHAYLAPHHLLSACRLCSRTTLAPFTTLLSTATHRASASSVPSSTATTCVPTLATTPTPFATDIAAIARHARL